MNLFKISLGVCLATLAIFAASLVFPNKADVTGQSILLFILTLSAVTLLLLSMLVKHLVETHRNVLALLPFAGICALCAILAILILNEMGISIV
jgi:hypothetical protein